MKILFKNCTLVSMSDERPHVEYHMNVLTKDNLIEKIDSKEIDESLADNVVNCYEMVLMPGFYNCHAHVGMGIFRETVDGLQTQDWLTKRIWPAEEKMTNDDLLKSCRLSFLEMVESGTIGCIDMYDLPGTLEAAGDLGIRLQTSRVCFGDFDNSERRKEQMALLNGNYDSRISFNQNIHGLYTTSDDNIREAVRLAKDNNLTLNMHFCENEEERNTIIESRKLNTPAEYVRDHFYGVKNILAHCVKITDEDLDILRFTNSTLCSCPISNLKLGAGIPNVKAWIEKGLPVCLGTDGQGSGCTLDMFDVMKFTALLQKGQHEAPDFFTAWEVLKLATRNGADAMGLNAGRIEEGRLADFILVDLSDTQSWPNNDILADLVYTARGTNVHSTIIDGKLVVYNKKLLTMDKTRILKDSESIYRRIEKELEEENK